MLHFFKFVRIFQLMSVIVSSFAAMIIMLRKDRPQYIRG